MVASVSRTTWWLLALVLTCTWFAGLDARRLQHPDEGRYAEIAREMAVSGDWLTPRLNDLKYFEKPPLQYWMGAAAVRAFGVHEWVARLPAAIAGLLTIVIVGLTASRLAGPAAGIYGALALAATVWHAGLAHLLTLDAVLSFWLAAALCAFLLAQQSGLSAIATRNRMLAAYAALAAATLTKGLVALVIPGATLVLYSLVTRDAGPWRRLHPFSGLALYLLLAAPWFVLVAQANPEFVQFFFVHEHFERFLTTTHNRTGEWYYFVPWFVLGSMPWLLVWAWSLRRSWREAPVDANGFAWERFCVIWAAFVFVFFSVSGSKLPSYILPMFPALALIIGFELTRISQRVLRWVALPLAIGASLALTAYFLRFDTLVAALASSETPAAIYQVMGPWFAAGIAVFSFGGMVAYVCFARDDERGRSYGIAALSACVLAGVQLAFLGQDAFAQVRSAYAILATAQRANGGPFDAAYPVYQVHSYDQTLPFYLQRPTPLVEYRDEMDLGLDAEPDKGYTDARWRASWQEAAQAYALLPLATLAELQMAGVPLRVLARDPRRAFIARR